MLRKTASMQQAWQASTATRRAEASSTRHGVASMQLGQPSAHGSHRSSLPELPRGEPNCPGGWAAPSSDPIKSKVGARREAWRGEAASSPTGHHGPLPALLRSVTTGVRLARGKNEEVGVPRGGPGSRKS